MRTHGGPAPTGLGASIVFAALIAVTTAGGAHAEPPGGRSPGADAAVLERYVRDLADDSMQGRGLGTTGLRDAILYVAQKFLSLGLQPVHPHCDLREILPSGHPLAGYLQEFRPGHGLPATANVIGLLPGRDPRSPWAVVVGAHVDHLGRDEDLEGDKVYNGADDNASGVAALLEIARLLALSDLEDRDRSVVFVVFSGEESGLLGSRHYCECPVVPLNEVIAMINLDSVGRMEERRLYVFGTGTAREFPSTLEGVNQAAGLDLVLRTDEVGGSDHSSFIARGVPAIHFFTGPHEDYSKVTDEADLIHYEGLALVADYAAELARYLRYRGRALTFVAPAAEETAKRERMEQAGERRVSLGFMPDFTMESGGVKIAQVTPDGPAALAGFEPGDVIVAIDGMPIESLVDYSTVLRMHAPGDEVSVEVRRDSVTLMVPVRFQERK